MPNLVNTKHECTSNEYVANLLLFNRNTRNQAPNPHYLGETMNQFNVLGIVERDDEYGLAYTTVKVSIDAKAWTRARNKGQLGMLYGVDIGNALSREHGIAAYSPTVDDRKRAVKGIKTVTLTYYKPATIQAPKFRVIQGGKV